MLAEPSDHLARVPRVHSVVLRRGHEKGWRVLGLTADQLVRGVPEQEVVPVIRVGIAVLPHPTCARQELVVPLHVQERDLADRGPEELGAPAGQHVAHEEAAVGAPLDGQAPHAGDPPAEEVLRHRLEVLVGPAAALPLGGLVPAGPVLAAPPDVRVDPDAPPLQPGGPARGGVGGRQGDLEAAVAVQQRRVRGVQDHAPLADLEVRHRGPVLGGREELRDLEVLRGEERGQRLEGRAGQELAGGQLSHRREEEARGAGVALDGRPELVRPVGVHGRELELLQAQPLVGAARLPRARRVLPEEQLGLHVVQDGEHEVVQGAGGVLQGLRRERLEERGEVLQRPREEPLDGDGEQRALTVAPPTHAPVAAQGEEEAVLEGGHLDVVRHVEAFPDALMQPEILRSVKGYGPGPRLMPDASVVVAARRCSDVRGLALENHLGLGEGRAAPPLANPAGVSRVRHVALAAGVRADEEHVARVVRGPGLAGPDPEAALPLGHEGPRLEAELPDGVGVAPAGREPDEAELRGRGRALVQQRLAVPDPALRLLAAQGVHVQHRLPGHLRGRPRVVPRRAAPPEPPHVLRVLPEVVVEVADLRDGGDLVLALQDLEDAAVGGAVVRVPKRSESGLVPLLRPVDALLVVHIFEPEVRVFSIGHS
mmetsp:Transcript_90378/g.264437  ORF Transcript_90378/g.264437 Transcript_90378/m.264437 type:complete len:654 (+) Transcript_90378:389-2350(+)